MVCRCHYKVILEANTFSFSFKFKWCVFNYQYCLMKLNYFFAYLIKISLGLTLTFKIINWSKEMAEVIKIPKMSDTMTEGVISSWLKKRNEIVSGDVLAEVETDKATMELNPMKMVLFGTWCSEGYRSCGRSYSHY